MKESYFSGLKHKHIRFLWYYLRPSTKKIEKKKKEGILGGWRFWNPRENDRRL